MAQTISKRVAQQIQLDKIYRTCGYNPREFKDAVVLYLGLKLG